MVIKELGREFQFKEKLKEFLQKDGFSILKDMPTSQGDLIVEKDGKKTLIEIKVKSTEGIDLIRALGQLIIGKVKHDCDKCWLVVDSIPPIQSRDIIEVFKLKKIGVLCLIDGKLRKITSKSLQKMPSKFQMERCEKIREFMKEKKKAVEIDEISLALGISKWSLRFLIRGIVRKDKIIGGWLREELLLDQGKVKPLVDEIKERLKLVAVRKFIESLKHQNKSTV